MSYLAKCSKYKIKRSPPDWYKTVAMTAPSQIYLQKVLVFGKKRYARRKTSRINPQSMVSNVKLPIAPTNQSPRMLSFWPAIVFIVVTTEAAKVDRTKGIPIASTITSCLAFALIKGRL